MRRAAALLTAAVVALTGLTACETTPDILFTYGAQGVEIQAGRLVANIYGIPADPIPYGNADIDYALQGIRSRWPTLRALLDDGTVGLTEGGDVAIHEIGARNENDLRELHALVKAENRDRFFLYRGMTAATGHDGTGESEWIGYVEERFARQWWKLAPKGWWIQDLHGNWSQKMAENARSSPEKP